jgi:hypothetical protein
MGDKMISLRHLITLPVLISISNQAAAQTIQHTYLRLYDISIQEKSTAQKNQALERYYAENIAPQQSDVTWKTPHEDVDFLFRSADVMSFYTLDPKYTRLMEEDLQLLERTGPPADRKYRDLYGAFLANREFAKAAQLIKRHPMDRVAQVPVVHGAADRLPLVLEVENSDRLKRRSANLPETQIVVIGHPLCHFTQRAVQYINSHKDIKNVFSTHSLWIVPPARELDLSAVAEWNKAHPAEKMFLAYSRVGWPDFDSWDTPTFYFLKNGKVVKEVVGWPKSGNAKEIGSGLAAIGLADPRSTDQSEF